MVDTRDKNVPKPSMLFFIATTIYSVVKYNIDAKNLTLATTCYIITIIIGHYLINVDLVTATCNSSNWRLAFIVTIIFLGNDVWYNNTYFNYISWLENTVFKYLWLCND